MELDFKFTSDGLIPAIVQQASGGSVPAGRVLMLAWMNREALEKSLKTGFMHYWSRSRKKLWLKGETSGHTQKIRRWYADCDRDVLLFEVEQIGGACHTGYKSCFFQKFDSAANLLAIDENKVFDEEEIYKNSEQGGERSRSG
ncbi:MAG TPA: phosphoribosyl-AMP cyclohydrolase [Terrimicrobiaceae bacterium]